MLHKSSLPQSPLKSQGYPSGQLCSACPYYLKNSQKLTMNYVFLTKFVFFIKQVILKHYHNNFFVSIVLLKHIL